MIKYFVLSISALALAITGSFLSGTFDNELNIADNRNYSIENFFPVEVSFKKRKQEKTVLKVLKSTLEIRKIFDDGATRPIGTGVVIDHPRTGLALLTAEHVAVSLFPHDIEVCTVLSGKCLRIPSLFLVEPNEGYPGQDWALYHLPFVPDDVVPAKINTSLPSLGEDVWLIGVPWGGHPWLSKGHISWVLKPRDQKPILLLGGFAAPGFSGGGVFNEKGELLGITVAVKAVPGVGLQVNQILAAPIQNIWFFNERFPNP